MLATAGQVSPSLKEIPALLTVKELAGMLGVSGVEIIKLLMNYRIMANLNTPDLEYAPAISDDGLEIHFTRGTGFLFWRKTQIERATRASMTEGKVTSFRYEKRARFRSFGNRARDTGR